MIKKHILIFALFAAVYFIFLSERFQTVLWDESVYLGMGKYIYSGGRVGLWESIRPPLLPLLLGFMWALGLPYIISAKIIILAFTLGAAYLVFLITKRLVNEKTAVVAMCILLISPIFFESSLRVMTEIPGVFFALCGVYFFIENRYYLAGIFAGLAFLTKYWHGLLFVAFLLLSWKKPKETVKILIPGTATIAVLLLWNLGVNNAAFAPLVLAFSHQYNPAHVIKDPLANILYYPYVIILSGLVIAFAVLGFKRRLLTIVVVSAVYLVYLTYVPNKQPRFAVLILPYFCILAASGIAKAEKMAGKYRWIALATAALLATPMVYVDAKNMLSFPANKPEIVSDYYEFFKEGDIVLSTEPVHVAYTDIHLIPFYNNITEASAGYDMHKDSVKFIVWNPTALPCYNNLSGTCESEKASLFERMNSENNLIFNKTYFGEEKYIFAR
ncbi:MAG: glycosyltransferase family 39 protein [Candidatus Woesearchaeota archaeon]